MAWINKKCHASTCEYYAYKFSDTTGYTYRHLTMNNFKKS